MIRVNLQPKIVAEAKTGFQMPVWVPVLLGVILVLGCGTTYWYMRFTVNNLQSQVTSLDFKIKDFNTIIDENKEAKADRDYLKAKRDFVADISSNQYKWIEFFDTFKSSTPKDIWINRMTVNRNGSFDIEGETFSYGAIGNFMVRLTAMPQLSGVTLSAAANKSGGGSGTEKALDANNKLFKINAMAALNPQESKTPTQPGAPGGAKRTTGAPRPGAPDQPKQMPE